MKKIFLLLTFLTVASMPAQELTPAEEEKVIDAVKKVLETARLAQEMKSLQAEKALKKALATETKCMNLYYAAVQEVDFRAKGKRASEFLAWKKKNREEMKKHSYRKAVKYQIRWLKLTSEVSRGGSSASPSMIIDFLDDFIEEAPDMYGSEKMIKENQMNSALAKAHHINELKISNWPSSPVDIHSIYRHFIFPPLKEAKDIQKLKLAWAARMKHEEGLIKAWDADAKGGLQGGGRADKSPRMVQFLTKVKPHLEWQMNLDLFEAGAEKQAVSDMLILIKQSSGQARSTDWAEELLRILE